MWAYGEGLSALYGRFPGKIGGITACHPLPSRTMRVPRCGPALRGRSRDAMRVHYSRKTQIGRKSDRHPQRKTQIA